MIVGLILLGLLFSAGIGWYVFRRMLLPANEVKLPPSGARPWSRTRAPAIEHHTNNANATTTAFANVNNVGQGNMMGAFAGNGPQYSFDQQNNGIMPLNNGFAPNAPVTGGLNSGIGSMAGLEQASRGLYTPPPSGPAPQGRPGTGQLPNGYASGNNFNNFSEGFIPPSPQMFPQNEGSMIPPGSGAFPVVNNGGFTPSSSAFSAMYGLPGEPFNSSQNNAPNWMQSLERENRRQVNTSGSGFSGPLQPPQQPAPQQSSANFSAKENLNDPYLAEVIRQYSQKSQALRPNQPQRPPNNGPNSEWIK